MAARWRITSPGGAGWLIIVIIVVSWARVGSMAACYVQDIMCLMATRSRRESENLFCDGLFCFLCVGATLGNPQARSIHCVT